MALAVVVAAAAVETAAVAVVVAADAATKLHFEQLKNAPVKTGAFLFPRIAYLATCPLSHPLWQRGL
jgi:hypothetical protein